MTVLKVTPTRITLLNLKRELTVARRGYKLLKDKRDGLMKKFLATVREAQTLRKRIEAGLAEAFRTYVRASAVADERETNVAFMLPANTIELTVKLKSVMSVPLPSFSLKKEGTIFSYGFLETSGELDRALIRFDELFPMIIKLAELEKAAESLAEEIERTRRRVSALENTRIPNLEDTIRAITMRLEEQARDATVSNMRIKAMLEARESMPSSYVKN
jgi:V/A-type H+/Na+-transporting ATPase subunit D